MDIVLGNRYKIIFDFRVIMKIFWVLVWLFILLGYWIKLEVGNWDVDVFWMNDRDDGKLKSIYFIKGVVNN